MLLQGTYPRRLQKTSLLIAVQTQPPPKSKHSTRLISNTVPPPSSPFIHYVLLRCRSCNRWCDEWRRPSTPPSFLDPVLFHLTGGSFMVFIWNMFGFRDLKCVGASFSFFLVRSAGLWRWSKLFGPFQRIRVFVCLIWP